jgi:Uri superfamily endonuclease
VSAALPLPGWEVSEPGTYLLLLWLAEPAELVVGRLGLSRFPAGWYVYVGSALGGLRPRLRRHLRRGKAPHWHVDVLREVAELVEIGYRLGPERLECGLAAELAAAPGATRPVARFGASDCRCGAHLFRFGRRPDPRIGSEWSVWSNPGARLDEPAH